MWQGAGIQDWESSTGNLVIRVGEPGDLPIPYDYFGEGKPRLAVFRPANGAVQSSSCPADRGRHVVYQGRQRAPVRSVVGQRGDPVRGGG